MKNVVVLVVVVVAFLFSKGFYCMYTSSMVRGCGRRRSGPRRRCTVSTVRYHVYFLKLNHHTASHQRRSRFEWKLNATWMDGSNDRLAVYWSTGHGPQRSQPLESHRIRRGTTEKSHLGAFTLGNLGGQPPGTALVFTPLSDPDNSCTVHVRRGL